MGKFKMRVAANNDISFGFSLYIDAYLVLYVSYQAQWYDPFYSF
jgi:hypothetical protein